MKIYDDVIEGDLLKEVKTGIIVHGCNAQGVMGGGFAYQVKKMYPEVFKTYNAWCLRYMDVTEHMLGMVQNVEVNRSTFYIANAITQDQYGTNCRHVNYEAVAQCFAAVANTARLTELHVHYPLIGAGLAGGNWNIISVIIDEALKGIPHTLWRFP